jgi:integrase/recombinase XerD
MITINYELSKRKDGKYGIYLRLLDYRTKKRINTGYVLETKGDFNPRPNTNKWNWIKESNPNAKHWNFNLKNTRDRYVKVYDELKLKGRDTITNILNEISRQENITFLAYTDSYIQNMKDDGRRTMMKIGISLRKFFEDFLRLKKKGQSDIFISDINNQLVTEFAEFLRKRPSSRQKSGDVLLHPNTIAKMLKIFHHIVLMAGSGGVTIDKDAFVNLNDPDRKSIIPREKGTDKKPLEIEEIHAIEKADLPPRSRLDDARNIFLFSFYAWGMRFGDCIQLRWRNISNWQHLLLYDGNIKFTMTYQMDKTEKSEAVELSRKAIRILQKYVDETSKPTDFIFPFLNNRANYAKYTNYDLMPAELNIYRLDTIGSKNAIVNKELKEVAILAGINRRDDEGNITIIKNLTMHVARHSYAYLSRNYGTSNNIIQETLGHGDLKETERYMHGLPSRIINDAVNDFYNSIDDSIDTSKAEALKLINDLNAQQLKDLIDQLKK